MDRPETTEERLLGLAAAINGNTAAIEAVIDLLALIGGEGTPGGVLVREWVLRRRLEREAAALRELEDVNPAFAARFQRDLGRDLPDPG